MPRVRFGKQTKQITEAVDKEVARAALGFQANIIKAWPVDTGFSRNAWGPPVQVKPGTWEVSNGVLYSSILWKGEHIVGDRLYGSPQLPNGGAPVLAAVISKMRKRLKDL